MSSWLELQGENQAWHGSFTYFVTHSALFRLQAAA
jgi:hypothetical protein